MKIMNDKQLNHILEYIDRITFMETKIGQHEPSTSTKYIIELYNEVIRLNNELDKKTKILNELKEWLEIKWKETQHLWYVKIINKLEKLEKEDK